MAATKQEVKSKTHACPSGHVQLKPPSLFWHSSEAEQVCIPIVHSSTSMHTVGSTLSGKKPPGQTHLKSKMKD